MNMKKIIVLTILTAFFLAGCSTQNINSKKIKVAATIFPLYDAVSEIGKDKVDAVLIVPSTSDPHNFSLSPKDIEKLQGVKIIFETILGWKTGCQLSLKL